MNEKQTDEINEKWCWRAFRVRMKARQVSDDDVYKGMNWVFWPYVVLSMIPMMMFSGAEDAASEWAFDTIYQWLLLPILGMVLAFFNYFVNFESLVTPEIQRRMAIWRYAAVALGRVFLPGMLGFGIAFSALGHVMLVDALMGSDELVAVQGPVVWKGDAVSRYNGYTAYIKMRYQNRDVKLQVSTQDYKYLKIGDQYGRMMYQGGSGYFYSADSLASWK